MQLRTYVSRWSLALAVSGAVALSAGLASLEARGAADQKDKDREKKPTISVKANPPVGFSPLRVILTAEVKGGPDDYEDFYCASVEWEWGDETKSENKVDCDPYEPGKSQIKRRYVMEHTFRSFTNNPSAIGATASEQGPTQVRVKFNLKQKNKVVGSGQTIIELRQGIGGQ
jgi:hypothetical protein